MTGPRGIGGGSNPTGGEYTEWITGTVMQGAKFHTFGGAAVLACSPRLSG